MADLEVDYALLREIASELRAVHESLGAASRQLAGAWADALAGAGDYETQLAWGCEFFMKGHGETLTTHAGALLATAADLDAAVELLSLEDRRLAGDA